MATEGAWASPPKVPLPVSSTSSRVATPEANNSSLPRFQIQTQDDPNEPSDPPERPGRKVININITINYPENLWPRCRRRRDHHGDGHGHAFRLDGGDRKGPPPNVLKIIIILFYISFVICGAVAWSIRIRTSLWGMEVAPLVLGTFSPFFDFAGNAAIIILLKKDKERDLKEERFRLAHLLTLQYNTVLTLVNFVILVYACAWKIDVRMQSWNLAKKHVIGLVLYSMSTMLFFKAVLALKVYHTWRSTKQSPPMEYRPLARDEEGRVQPGTVVDFSDDDQTPRQSEERVRLL